MSEIKVKQGTEITIELPGLAAVRIDTQHRQITVDNISGEPRHDEPLAPDWKITDLRDGTYGDFHRLLAPRYCGDSDCIAKGEHDRARMVRS